MWLRNDGSEPASVACLCIGLLDADSIEVASDVLRTVTIDPVKASKLARKVGRVAL